MKNKPNVIIIDETCTTSMLVQQLIKHANEDVVIVVDTKESKKENPFENPPTPLINYHLEPLREPVIKFHIEERNPYPSPKGRRGKKRY